MKNKFIFLLLGIYLLIGIASALDCSEYTWGCIKQGDTINLVMVCPLDGCNQTNLTKITFPNSTIALSNQLATHEGNTWNYNFNNTLGLGTYTIYGYSSNGTSSSDEYFIGNFEVTPSGTILKDSQGLSIIGSILIMIILALSFLFIASKSESIGVKITFYCLSGIFFIISILYTVVVMQQTLFGFDKILSGIETFWFVVKVLIGLGILALIIIVTIILFKSWKIKRGYSDE
jgi:hypothetical protein